MSPIPVIAIFDVGKTNKKIFLFDENYKIVFEKSARFIETEDEDGYPCENLESLRLSIFDSLNEIFRLKQFKVKAVNFSAYGASFVYLNVEGKPLAPLYNYLKPYPEKLLTAFYKEHGGREMFSLLTASPALGSLNSGLQLFRLKKEKPELFKKVHYALHLPQYLSFLLSGQYYSDLTSIGCHTALWDFKENDYHNWIYEEGLNNKLAPIAKTKSVSPALFPGANYKVGVGLHDSSAALIPYLVNFQEPFILLSTGTWCISLNPFNHSPLHPNELVNDCLCYLEFHGKPVKASRLFSGFEHDLHVKRIADRFKQNVVKYRNMEFYPEVIVKLQSQSDVINTGNSKKSSSFAQRDLSKFNDDVEAYHQLILDLVALQVVSTGYILKETPVKRIFVDGGFSKNAIFMNLLASSFPQLEVFAASMAQASAVGAALAIHSQWNNKPIPKDIIQLNYYSASQTMSI